jgi:hypothetical protein
MRVSKLFWNVSPALLTMAALILIAGAAAGQGFFDSSESIDPGDGYEGTAGYVDGSGSDFSTGVSLMCVDINNNFEIGCDSDHPDKVNLSTKQGQVEQKKRGNNADAWMVASKLNGVDVDINESLDCEKVQLKGKANNVNQKIDVKCTLKKCELPAGVTPAQIDAVIDCAVAAVGTGDIGRKAGRVSQNSDDQLSGHIRSKGVLD